MANIAKRVQRAPTLKKAASVVAEDLLVNYTNHRNAKTPRKLALQAATDDIIEDFIGLRPFELHRRLHPRAPTRKPTVQRRASAVSPTENSHNDPELQRLQRLKDFIDGKNGR